MKKLYDDLMIINLYLGWFDKQKISKPRTLLLLKENSEFIVWPNKQLTHEMMCFFIFFEIDWGWKPLQEFMKA